MDDIVPTNEEEKNAFDKAAHKVTSIAAEQVQVFEEGKAAIASGEFDAIFAARERSEQNAAALRAMGESLETEGNAIRNAAFGLAISVDIFVVALDNYPNEAKTEVLLRLAAEMAMVILKLVKAGLLIIVEGEPERGMLLMAESKEAQVQLSERAPKELEAVGIDASILE